MDDKDFELESIISDAIEKKKNGITGEISAEQGVNYENESAVAEETVENKDKPKKEKKKMKKSTKIILIVLISIIAVALIICGGLVALAYHYINKMDIVPHQGENFSIVDSISEEDLVDSDVPDSPKEEIDKVDSEIENNVNGGDSVNGSNGGENKKPIPPAFDKDVYNILLIGTDARNVNERGRSDTMILVSINQKKEEIHMTSFMRDSYVAIPGKQNNRINAAYAYGGPDLLMQTIEQNFKIKIDKYARVNFFAFMEVIDAVGGVTINVTDAEVPVLNSYVHELNGLLGKDYNDGILSKGGTYNLTGKQALGYCRIRYVGNADFQRTQRQRDVMMKVFEKAKGLSVSELDEFLNVLLPKITTNIQDDEIFNLLLNTPKYLKYDVIQHRVPADKTYSFLTVRRMSVLGIDFDKNIKMLHDSIYG